MTRLGYLLPVLWALGWSQATSTIKPTTAGSSAAPVTTNTQVTIPVATTAVIQSNSAASMTAATIAAVTFSPTTKLPTLSGGHTQPPTTVSSVPQGQGATHSTTIKLDTNVGTTSSQPIVASTKPSTPNVASTNDNSITSIQPTNKALTTVLKVNTGIAVTSQASTTGNAAKVAATSLPFSRSSEQSTEITSKLSSTAPGLSTVTPSPVTTSKSTAGSISETTKSWPREKITDLPNTIPPVKYNQEDIEVNCKGKHEGSLVKINIKSSSICGKNANVYEEDANEILNHICTALKPHYQPKKDKCHIDLSSGIPDQLAVVNAYVQSSLSPEDLYESLKHIKQNGSNLFQYDQSKYQEEDVVSIPLISAIVSLAVLLLIIAAIYGCWHQRQTRKREQRLTEELQTMENGYHDNPTLEVMETSPEMQEKKGGPNGELGDSWIVPLDNLTREDLDEEEDTHL